MGLLKVLGIASHYLHCVFSVEASPKFGAIIDLVGMGVQFASPNHLHSGMVNPLKLFGWTSQSPQRRKKKPPVPYQSGTNWIPIATTLVATIVQHDRVSCKKWYVPGTGYLYWRSVAYL